MNKYKFDAFLSEASESPTWIYMSPYIWNGYWSVYKIPKVVRKLFWYLGKVTKNKYLGWVGLPLYWEKGLKDYYPEIPSNRH